MNLEVYLQEIMRNVAASLMVPVMIVLVCLILFAVYSVGSVIAEWVTERRHFKANMPRDIKAIKDASYAALPDTIEETGLLRCQKEALQVIVANMGLPEDDLFALAKAEVSATDARYRRKVSRTDLVTKIAPMMGLMCTLIPLGPGIVAMGQGEVNLLSNSLLVAFDGTVAGLIGGVVSMVVSAIRKRWYANYLVAMESLTTCVLEKAEEARFDGVILPYEGDIRAKADSLRSEAASPERKKRRSGKAETAQSGSPSAPKFQTMDAFADHTSAQDVRGAISTLRSEYVPAAGGKTPEPAIVTPAEPSTGQFGMGDMPPMPTMSAFGQPAPATYPAFQPAPNPVSGPIDFQQLDQMAVRPISASPMQGGQR